MSLLCQCRTEAHHKNAILLATNSWCDVEGMNEPATCTNYLGNSSRFVTGLWHYDSMNMIGYFPWTQSLDRYHLSLKGNSRKQEQAVIRFDVGLERFLTYEIPKLLAFDYQMIVNLPVGHAPSKITKEGLPIPYEMITLALLMSEDDFFILPPLPNVLKTKTTSVSWPTVVHPMEDLLDLRNIEFTNNQQQ